MFHNLRNRQGRIAELTLPASNIERFLWHAFVVLVGAHVWFLMSVGLAEILNAILVSVTFDFGDYEYVSLTAKVCNDFYRTLPTAMVFDEARLNEELMARLVGKAHKLGFYRGAVSRTCAGDVARIHSGSVEV